MIQTNKTLLAVLGIVVAVGFVAANSMTSPASAQVACKENPDHPKNSLQNPGQGNVLPRPCVGQGNVFAPGYNPGLQHKLQAGIP